MILEITLSSKSLFVEYIRKERFYLACEENGICYYRKYWNGEPFIEQAMIKDSNVITHSNSPKEYQRLYKLLIRNKIDILMVLLFSEKFKQVVLTLVKDPNFSFCFSESFNSVINKNITCEMLMKSDFYFKYDERYRLVSKL